MTDCRDSGRRARRATARLPCEGCERMRAIPVPWTCQMFSLVIGKNPIAAAHRVGSCANQNCESFWCHCCSVWQAFVVKCYSVRRSVNEWLRVWRMRPWECRLRCICQLHVCRSTVEALHHRSRSCSARTASRYGPWFGCLSPVVEEATYQCGTMSIALCLRMFVTLSLLRERERAVAYGEGENGGT